MLYLKNWSYLWIKCNFVWFFWFLISLVFYIRINIKKIQIYFSKFNTCTLIINYISKSCCSLSKKDLKVAKFCLRCTPCHFSKNARFLMVIFIGHRQSNNTYFYLLTTAYTTTPFCSSNLLFIQQLLDILYSFLKKKRKQIDVMS
jgi:hypothetical protein